MDERPLGRTGVGVSALGFGCGNVGGLVVRGTPPERERAIGRAIELGLNYFDTAPSYGDGLSEQHLGEALRALGADVVVGTKFALGPDDRQDVAGAVRRSVDASLSRLGREQVDLLQLHNAVGAEGLSPAEVLEEVVPALEQLRQEGKTRFVGLTGLGETGALHEIVDAGVLETVQSFFNLLNPSAAYAVPEGFPAHDFDGLISRAHARGMGVIVVRALAGGALSGDSVRHPIAASDVEPISTGPDYTTDVGRAAALQPLVDEGYAESLVEAALRFPLATEAVSTVLLGYSSLEQLEYAAAAVETGPLPPEALERLSSIWSGLAG